MYGVPKEQAERSLREVDKKRASYLKAYTDQIFGQAENYHLRIDSGTVGIDNTVKMIETTYQTLQQTIKHG